MKWSAPEYHYYPKNDGWYWLVGCIAISIVAIAFWQHNFLFAVFTIIAAGVVISWGRRPPQIIVFELTEHGIVIAGKLYDKHLFEKFAVQKEVAEWSRLLLKKKGRLAQYILVPILTKEFDTIKQYCLTFWAESEYQESFVDEFSQLIKF